MTLVLLQYPPVIITFLLCAVCVLMAAKLPSHGFIPALIAGVAGIATVILALMCSVPMAEILAMLLVVLILAGISLPRGGKP